MSNRKPDEKPSGGAGCYLITRKVIYEQTIVVDHATSKRDAKKQVKNWGGELPEGIAPIAVTNHELIKVYAPASWEVDFQAPTEPTHEH